jgi:hypothetical protein
MSGGRKRLFRENENVWTRMSVMLSQDDHWVGHAITYGCRRKVGVSLGTKAAVEQTPGIVAKRRWIVPESFWHRPSA